MGKKVEKGNKDDKKKGMNAEPDAGAPQDKKERKVIEDARFSSVHSDPRFQKVPNHQSKVTIDSRFNQMFTDKKFSSSSASVDKRGKPKNHNTVNPLRHYYKIEEEKEKKKRVESEDDDEDENEDIEDENPKEFDSGSSYSDESSLKDDLENIDSGSTGSDTDDEDAVYSDEEPEEPKEKIPEIEQETNRLAIVNMDWSQVRAVDLYVLMNSFRPKGGQILSVTVYPSEFGLKRMEEEAVKGPVGLFDSDTEKSDDEDNDEIDNEKLRAYEKSRLRYYFAVVDCDSAATADCIYKACDGIEFERTSNKLDLRFIPDTMQFTQPPRDVATEVPSKYDALDFHTQALQQTKIHLSWDEDEPQRAKTLRRNLNADQLAELEMKEFLASDDGESGDTDDDIDDNGNDGVAEQNDKKLDKLEKYRALLQAGGGSDADDCDNDNDNDMEVTFNTGLEDISKRFLEKKMDKKSETVWEANLRKQKEKKKGRKSKAKDSSEDESGDSDLEVPEQPDDFFIDEPSIKNSKTVKHKKKLEQDTDKEKEASKAELELLLADDEAAANKLKGYNLKPKKAKSKKAKEVTAEDKIPSAAYDDPRFSALFTSSLFALDPTDAQYKRSATYARQLAQKQQKGAREEIKDTLQKKPQKETPSLSDDSTSKRNTDNMSSKIEKAELSSMVRSLKRKSQQYQEASNGNTSKKVISGQSNRLLPKLSTMLMSGKKKSRASKS